MLSKIILKKPVKSEKSFLGASRGVFTFIVDLEATKNDIKKAIEKEFNVHVVSVKTVVMKGKVKTAGRKRKKVEKSDQKKAFITLKEGEKIDLFEAGGTK
jgi:large subunit ribosomal protein L23